MSSPPYALDCIFSPKSLVCIYLFPEKGSGRLDSGDSAPNPRQDGPDVQDKVFKKYNKSPPFMIGYGPKEDQ